MILTILHQQTDSLQICAYRWRSERDSRKKPPKNALSANGTSEAGCSFVSMQCLFARMGVYPEFQLTPNLSILKTSTPVFFFNLFLFKQVKLMCSVTLSQSE